jgi:hypothetical protein
MKRMRTILTLSLFICSLTSGLSLANDLDDYKYRGVLPPMDNTITDNIQFNGYTNYWHDTYREWIRYGNLYKMSIPNVEYTIAQSKVDVAEDLLVPGLVMQEGFLADLLAKQYASLFQPTIEKLETSLKNGNVLAFVDPESGTGKKIAEKQPKENSWNEKLQSHQYDAADFVKINAFYLENNGRKLFVVSSTCPTSRARVKELINHTADLLEDYDLHRGWFGTKTLLKSVTCSQGHPLEVIGRGMNEGNSWFTFDGYMEFLAQNEISDWLAKVNLPIIADVGFSPIYGCKDYDGLQVQDMGTKEAWIEFAKKKSGFIFRPVYDPASDPYRYDGVIASAGNKEQIDNEDVPFVLSTGSLQGNAESCMVLFVKKGEQLSKEKMWDAILDRREVAVLPQGRMMGPKLYRNALQLLLLDRVFLEEYFGDRIILQAKVNGYNLELTISNTYHHSVAGQLTITLPPELKIKGDLISKVNLPAQSNKSMHFKIQPGPDAMDRTNPIAVNYEWGDNKKSTLTMLDLPRAISIHELLYGHEPKVSYPVTIHNFSQQASFPVKVQVLDQKKVVYSATQTCKTAPSTFQELIFDLPIPAGDYKVHVSALGLENISQLGVGKSEGAPYLYNVDLNSDGIDEYRMENDSVQVTLLTIGARVIEYIVKSRDDNVLFKLWPKRAVDHRQANRKRGYYPYGGFEDFLGQGSMETHRVYDAEIIQKEGDYVRLKMSTDYFGNRLEKTFTLYGNSPLLEVRFALTFKNPEANVLGPQPILELGEKHWTEDVFYAPTLDGLQEYRMRPEEYYGRLIYLKEGWNAGHDSKADISFVGAYPVSEPLFLHMWMNHPSNAGARHYYTEFQPWTPIYQKSVMYFSYYIWGAGGPWENGVDELRNRNLISVRQNDSK